MKSNKGFSLVELIIVICIVAVLVGLIAPQLIKYMEKSKVSSDEQTLNSIYIAVTYAALDPSVLKDQDSKDLIEAMVTSPMKLEDLESYKTTALYNEILDSLRWDDLTQATYLAQFQSAHAADSTIYMQYKGSVVNPMAMWITKTDKSGGKDTTVVPSGYTDVTNMEKVISIY